MAENSPSSLSDIPPPRPPAKRTSGVIVPHQAKWHQRLAAFLIAGLIRGIGLTIRYQLNDRSGHFTTAPKEPIIFAIWHNRLALSVVLYQRYLRRHEPRRQMAGLVSASKDGGLLARVLEKFRIQPVRGSSSRRGPQALREMISWGERGYDLAITPDGPRGPCYTVQEGVISTAQLTGLLIAPVAYHVNWKLRLKSWDRFQIPLPFARCEITTGRVLRIPRDATEADRETFRQQLETEMRSITRD